MDLTEFVKETVVQVARGVRLAQGEVRTLGTRASSDDTFMVKFDVIVAVSNSHIADEGNRIKVVSEAGSEQNRSAQRSNLPVHRISFQVPFSLSVDDPVKRKIQEQQAKNQAAIDQRIERFTSPFS